MFRAFREQLGSAEIWAIKIDSLTIEWYLTDFLIYNVLSRNGCGMRRVGLTSLKGGHWRFQVRFYVIIVLSSGEKAFWGNFKSGGSAERSTPQGALGELAVATASWKPHLEHHGHPVPPL